MATAKKFMFDNIFEDPQPPEGKPAEGPQEAENEPAEQVEEIATFSEEDLKAARDEGLQAGKEEGLNASLDSVERQVSATLGNLQKEIAGLIERQQEANQEASQLALSVAISVSRKMLPQMAAANAGNEIEKVMADVLPRIVKEPRLAIRVHGDIAAEINARLEKLVDSLGYQGVVAIHPDNELEIGDCKLQWSCGGAERDSEAMWREIDGVIARHVGDDQKIEPEQTDPENVTQPPPTTDA